MLYYTILYYTILYYTILYYTILYYTILYYTILYYTILYYTILYYTILYYTILYNTALKSGHLIGGLASRDIEYKFPFHDRAMERVPLHGQPCIFALYVLYPEVLYHSTVSFLLHFIRHNHELNE